MFSFRKFLASFIYIGRLWLYLCHIHGYRSWVLCHWFDLGPFDIFSLEHSWKHKKRRKRKHCSKTNKSLVRIPNSSKHPFYHMHYALLWTFSCEVSRLFYKTILIDCFNCSIQLLPYNFHFNVYAQNTYHYSCLYFTFIYVLNKSLLHLHIEMLLFSNRYFIFRHI